MKTGRNHYMILVSLVALCVAFVFGGSIGGTTYAHGTMQVSQVSGVVFKRRPDLQVINFKATQGTCVSGPSYLSGYRNINFEVILKNTGSMTSSPYYTMIYKQSGGLIVGGGDNTVLAPGQYNTGGFGSILPRGYQYFTVTVYPLTRLYVPGQQNPMDVINWGLDSNPTNNTASSRIYLEPCPQ